MSTPHELSETPQVCYAMAYFLLPQYCSERPDSLLQALKMGPRAGAAFFYVMTCQMRDVEPRDDVVQSLSVSTGKLADATIYHIISYPTPWSIDRSHIPEDSNLNATQKIVLAPYFSAVLEYSKTNEIVYYILGQSPDGFTTLWTVDGKMKVNLGRGCEPRLESFVELLRSKATAR